MATSKPDLDTHVVKLPPFFKRASTKVTIAVGGIACLLVAVSMMLARGETNKGLRDAEAYHLTAIGNLLTESVRAAVAFDDHEMVEESIADIAPSLPGVMQVIVEDKYGNQVAKWQHESLHEGMTENLATKTSYILGGDGKEVTGSVVVSASRKELERTLASQDRLMLIIILVTLVVAGVLSLFLGKYQGGLEARVAARTFEISKRNREMRLVFENVDQGFVMLNRNADMAMERSAVVDLWFGSYAESLGFSEYLEKSDSNFAMNFELGWESLVDGFMPVELCLDQLPKRIEVAEQVFSVAYSVLASDEAQDDDEDGIHDEDNWNGVLVVVADITEQIAFEKAQAEQQELGTAIKTIISDRQGFGDFFNDTQELVDRVCSGSDGDVVVIKRNIHTVKGNAGIFGFSSISFLCHNIETEMEDSGEAPSEVSKRDLRACWNRLGESVSYLLGNESSTHIEISEHDYANHLAELSQLSEPILFDAAFAWQLEPIEKPLDRLATKARQIALRMGVPELRFEVDVADSILVDSGQWSSFWNELIHVLRNSLDHGIARDPDQDKQHGMCFSARKQGDDVVIEVADNGSGINWEAIREKAGESGLPTATRSDLVAAIFHDGLSSSTDITTTSGRGVGMAAVKAIVRARGGAISVDSEPGKGTTFRFTFPQERLFGSLYELTVKQAAAQLSA